jgi:thiol-disulfide isomerase/thioredoxin
MHRRSFRTLLIASAALSIVVTIATSALIASTPQDAAAPPAAPASTDALLEQKMTRFFEWYRDNQTFDVEKMGAFVEELLADVDLNSLSASQIGRLSQSMYIPPSIQAKLQERLAVLVKSPTADGAEAAIASIPMSMQTGRATDAIRAALNHPGLAEALKAGKGSDLFNMLTVFPPDELRGMKDQILGLDAQLNDSMPPRAIASLSTYLEAVNAMGDSVDAATKSKIRAHILDLTKSAAAKAKAEGDTGTADYLEGTARYLDGAYARGELIDHPAPKVAFKWSSSEPPLASLEQLKGKVVVLDFWATWCGPCVASFPSVGELQKHYEGYPVAIIGVTSIQGMHITPDRQQVSTEGDEQKELDLMKEYIAQQKITWTIAFSEDSVFNPEFGVRGIPHVAIIDAEGIVRYNGLHPSSPLAEKSEKIDALLKKAGLPTPAPVVASPQPLQPGEEVPKPIDE